LTIRCPERDEDKPRASVISQIEKERLSRWFNVLMKSRAVLAFQWEQVIAGNGCRSHSRILLGLYGS
jgi:hypothetical protein